LPATSSRQPEANHRQTVTSRHFPASRLLARPFFGGPARHQPAGGMGALA